MLSNYKKVLFLMTSFLTSCSSDVPHVGKYTVKSDCPNASTPTGELTFEKAGFQNYGDDIKATGATAFGFPSDYFLIGSAQLENTDFQTRQCYFPTDRCTQEMLMICRDLRTNDVACTIKLERKEACH